MDTNKPIQNQQLPPNPTPIVELDLSNQDLEQIPNDVLSNSNLESLDLSCNALSTFSVNFLAVSNLQYLNLEQNYHYY